MSETTTNPVTVPGTRVRVLSYGGFTDNRYAGQEGTVASFSPADYIEVRLDSEADLPEDVTLPCLPEELEVIE